MLSVFQSNIELALRNLRLHKDMEEMQYEIITKLGDAVESRSTETGNHVLRVAEHTYLLSSLSS